MLFGEPLKMNKGETPSSRTRGKKKIRTKDINVVYKSLLNVWQWPERGLLSGSLWLWQEYD